MNLALWIAAGFLAMLMFASGATKLVRSKEALVGGGLAVLESFRAGTIKLVGALELAAALALVIPPAVGRAEFLAPLAALGVAILMAAAVALHLRRREGAAVAMTCTLLVVSAAIAWERLGTYAFQQ